MPDQTLRLHHIILLGALSLSLLLLSWLVFQPTPLAEAQAPLPRVIAWMPGTWDTDEALASFRKHQDQIDEISPFWYGMAADGTLQPFDGVPNATLVSEARKSAILVIPTISNSFDPERVHTVLSNDTFRAQHIQAIVYEVVANGYDGIDIDYENLYAADKDAYSQFLAELAVALHDYNRLLTVAVQAKTNTFAGWDGVGALDYQAIGAVADEVRIMTYGWCWRTGCVGSDPPGPIAPLHWVEDVILYARRLIPPEKLILGIPLYGYDWWPDREGGSTRGRPQAWFDLALPNEPGAPGAVQGVALNWWDVQALITEHSPDIQWWESDDAGLVQEHWFSYAGDHSVVYADQDSVRVRWKLAQKQGLGGVALWYLGSDDPRIWEFLGKPVLPTATPTPTSTPSPTPKPSWLFLPFLQNIPRS